MRKINHPDYRSKSIFSFLLICIFSIAVVMHFSFVPAELTASAEENIKIISSYEINSENFKQNDSKFSNCGKYETLNKKNNSLFKRNSSLKRKKNESLISGILSENYFNKEQVKVISSKSRFPFVNISYLKFLRISKMLC